MPSKSHYEQMNRELCTQRNEAEEKIARVGQWCRDMLDRHQPYVSGRIDVGLATHENKHAELVERIGKSIYCNECRTPFPCRESANLIALRDMLYTGEYEELPTKQKPDQPGTIETAM